MTVRRAAVLLGTPIDDVTMDESLDIVAAMVETGRRTGRVHQVATVNVDFVVNAAADDQLRSIMCATDLSIPDGMGIVWAARMVGTPIRERTAGVDLVPALAHRAAVEGWRLGLFGGRAGVAERAAVELRKRADGLDVVVVAAPTVGADGSMDEAVLDELRATDADVLGVALGNPKQERWIARWGLAVGAPVCIGIGGTLDFLTGTTRRAPMWMQRAGLEWIHRASSEPRRLVGRYAHDLAVFGPALARQMWDGRRRAERGAVQVAHVPTLEPAVGPTVIDLAGLRRLDNAAVAQIAAEQRAIHLAGRDWIVARPSAVVRSDARRRGVEAMLAPPLPGQSRPAS